MHRKKIMTQPEENVFANIVLNSTLCAMAYSNLIKKEDLYFKKKKKKKTTNPSLTGLYNLKKTILMKSLEKKEDPLNLFLESDSKQFFPFIQERDDLNRIITTVNNNSFLFFFFLKNHFFLYFHFLLIFFRIKKEDHRSKK